MKYLKYFKQSSDYQSFKNSSEYILPNVSYVEEIKGVSFEPKKAFVLRAKYNATPDNLVAFNGASNIKAMKVNGNSITIEPIKNEINNFDVLGENISINMETGEATFPESYLIKSPVSSWSFKAKDPNYTINENTYVCMLGMMDGMTIAQPQPLEEIMSYAFTTNDGVTLEVTDTFLPEVNRMIQSGTQIGFTLMDVDMNNQTFMFIDTEHQTNVTTGGMSTYLFDSEGLYDVEIELADPDMKDIQFTETPLISIKIDDGVTSIGDNAFSYCSSLKEVTIGSGVTSIGNYAFSSCTGLTGELVIPDSVTSIGDYVFNVCSGLTSIIIPDNITTISNGAFYNCSELTSVIIPNSVTSINNGAFNGCSNLASVTIPDSVTSVGDGAFQDCTSLTSIVIPDSVTYIGGGAFGGCSSLTSVTIGNSITSIIPGAFSSCTSLNEITCLATTAPSIQNGTFANVKENGILRVPTGSDYSSWMITDPVYLGYYNWTVEYI